MRDTMIAKLTRLRCLPRNTLSKNQDLPTMWNAPNKAPTLSSKLLCGAAFMGLMIFSGGHYAAAQDQMGIPAGDAIGQIDAELLQGAGDNEPAEPEMQNLLPEETPPLVPNNTDLSAPADTASSAPAANAGGIDDDDVFYDAEALVPEGELGKKSHRALDPVTEPASRMIIVRKNAAGDTRHARLVSAERALKLGRDSSALEIYNELYKKNKRNKQVLMGRAIALQKLGLIEEAILAYEELLEVQPGNIEARANMLGLMATRYPAVAVRQLKDLRANNPDNVALVAQLGIAEAQMGNLDSAMRYMGVAASMEPNNASHYYNLAIIADQSGAKKDAVRYYEQALEVDSIYGGNRTVPREAIYTRLAKLR
ncbi:MAG: hypothetical protein CMH27_04500 [Micavibrio sp.]|nr:hypothetical protein [Micavibrio sp.]|tara:strand:- start:5403 stop:6506 length:1104 start_codon:yes stop_codon:yes gene_type:complete